MCTLVKLHLSSYFTYNEYYLFVSNRNCYRRSGSGVSHISKIMRAANDSPHKDFARGMKNLEWLH